MIDSLIWFLMHIYKFNINTTYVFAFRDQKENDGTIPSG